MSTSPADTATSDAPAARPEGQASEATPARKRRVAIACQGGGSHTAFTAGALARFMQPDVLEHYDVVALSGTSGGAICASIVWTALIERRPEDAAAMLRQFWEANSARSWTEQTLNSMILWGSRVAEAVSVPAVNPYTNPGSILATNQLRRLVDQTVDLEAAQQRALEMLNPPELHLGAVEAVRGRFKTFSSDRGEISTDAILASAAIPTLFRSVKINGGVYWDGLFSQNPPVNILQDCEPDELWVIQINPSSVDKEPTSVGDIATRRNELAGNLSLYQELGFMERMSAWLADGKIRSDSVHPITIRILEMNRTSSSHEWGYTSKLNRDPQFIEELLELGQAQAHRMVHAINFERAWDDDDLAPLLHRFHPATKVSSTHPLAPLDPTKDPKKIATFFEEFRLRVEPSRKRVFENSVRWTVQSVNDARIRARVMATFEDGHVTQFRVTEA
ncbi:MAG: patatin-like phospholipase family protein [Micrococcus sp.]|nr:patatin-like phospholipase family protein [Micrococcus sp.]